MALASFFLYFINDDLHIVKAFYKCEFNLVNNNVKMNRYFKKAQKILLWIRYVHEYV